MVELLLNTGLVNVDLTNKVTFTVIVVLIINFTIAMIMMMMLVYDRGDL